MKKTKLYIIIGLAAVLAITLGAVAALVIPSDVGKNMQEERKDGTLLELAEGADVIVITEPVATEPVATEPVVTEPVATEPVVTEPVAIEPEPTKPEVTVPVEPLTQEQMEKQDRILLYTAFADSGFTDRMCAASLGLMEYAPGEYDYLQKTIPVEGDWDKQDVLLLMGWNQEEILDVQYNSGNGYGGVGGTYSYSVSVAENLLTQMYGPVDLDAINPNIYVNGYSTSIEDGMLYHAADHVYGDNYGELTVEGVKDLGGGRLQIYAIYTRKDDTVYCIYDAVKNPDSYIGCTLTGVSYSLQPW